MPYSNALKIRNKFLNLIRIIYRVTVAHWYVIWLRSWRSEFESCRIHFIFWNDWYWVVSARCFVPKLARIDCMVMAEDHGIEP